MSRNTVQLCTTNTIPYTVEWGIQRREITRLLKELNPARTIRNLTLCALLMWNRVYLHHHHPHHHHHHHHHHAVCLTIGPKPLTQRVLRKVRSSTSCFDFHYPPFPLRSSSSTLRLLPRLLVTSILPSFLH
jgi:hypothetical protein